MESLAVKLASCLEPDKMHFSWLALSLPPVHTLTLQLLLLDTGSLSLDEKESIAKVDALIWRSDLAKLSGQGNNYRPLAVILEDGLTLKTYERFPNIPHLFKSRSISMLIFLFLEPISQERAITVQLLYSCLALTRLSQRGRSQEYFGWETQLLRRSPRRRSPAGGGGSPVDQLELTTLSLSSVTSDLLSSTAGLHRHLHIVKQPQLTFSGKLHRQLLTNS